jgi:hypothetical protein
MASTAGTVGGVGAFLQADLADFTASGGAEKGKASDNPPAKDADIPPDTDADSGTTPQDT